VPEREERGTERKRNTEEREDEREIEQSVGSERLKERV